MTEAPDIVKSFGMSMQEAADAFIELGATLAEVWKRQLQAMGFDDVEAFLAWRQKVGTKEAFKILEARGVDFQGWTLDDEESE
jgi:hypothetical protein